MVYLVLDPHGAPVGVGFNKRDVATVKKNATAGFRELSALFTVVSYLREEGPPNPKKGG